MTRYLTYRLDDGSCSWGIGVGEHLVDGPKVLADTGLRPIDDLLAFVRADPADRAAAVAALRAATPHHELASVTLAAPLLPPRDIFAVGANYATHLAEALRAGTVTGTPSQPVIFTKALTSVCGPSDDVLLVPELTSQLDYEVELGVVIGTGGRDIAEADALSHVFGYTVVNDISARDVQHQRAGGQWFIGKSMDTYCPIGPWLVGAEDIEDPTDLPLSLSVNGEVRQSDTTANLIFGIEVLIAEISRYLTLLPGDLIATGTPSGVGASADPPVFLTGGDVVEATVGGIGTLRNTVVIRE